MVLSEAEGLLKIATADLETAEASSDPAVFREGAWGFWLQQAVEKALKAWLLHLDVGAPLTHDLHGRSGAVGSAHRLRRAVPL